MTRRALANAAPANENGDWTAGLTAKQKALVENVIRHNRAVADAGKAAGYASEAASYNAWSKLKRSGVVASALRDLLADAAIAALNTVLDLSSTAEREDVRLNAARDVLNRSGMVEKDAVGGGTGGVTVVIDLG